METYADIYGVTTGLKELIAPYTTELGNGKNAAHIAKIVAQHYPKNRGLVME